MTANTETSFGRRLWRALVTLIKLALVLALLAGLSVAGFFGFQELQRSFDSVTTRIEANSDNVTAVNDRLRQIEAEIPLRERQMAALADDLAAIGSRLSSLQNNIEREMVEQGEMLTELEAGMETMATDVSLAMAESTQAMNEASSLNSAVTALQSDIIENTGQIDALGGAIDGVRGEIASLDTSLEGVRVESEASAVSRASELQEILILFRVWELITRARLRLVENNAGLAAEDTAVALRTVDTLVAAGPEDEVTDLQVLQTRLALASTSLPEDPVTAAQDLESAWNALDGILAALVNGGSEAAASTAPAEAVTEAESVAPTPTPPPAPVPSPTPTPSP